MSVSRYRGPRLEEFRDHHEFDSEIRECQALVAMFVEPGLLERLKCPQESGSEEGEKGKTSDRKAEVEGGPTLTCARPYLSLGVSAPYGVMGYRFGLTHIEGNGTHARRCIYPSPRIQLAV